MTPLPAPDLHVRELHRVVSMCRDCTRFVLDRNVRCTEHRKKSAGHSRGWRKRAMERRDAARAKVRGW